MWNTRERVGFSSHLYVHYRPGENFTFDVGEEDSISTTLLQKDVINLTFRVGTNVQVLNTLIQFWHLSRLYLFLKLLHSPLLFYFKGPRKRGNIVAETLLRKHCCGRKCFPVCARTQHLLRTQNLGPRRKKCF